MSVTGNDQQFINDRTLHFRDIENTFTYYQPFEIESISNNMVTTEGNTPVTIRAFNFDQFKNDNRSKSSIPIWCRYVEDNDEAKQIGNAQAMQKVSDTDMICPSPKSDFNGNSHLEFSVNKVQWQRVKGNPIKFFNGPRVTSVNPISGVTKNPKHLNLTIIGENFECPGNDCSRIKVRFTNDKGDEIFVDGHKNE